MLLVVVVVRLFALGVDVKLLELELELELVQMLQESLQREEMEAWEQRCTQAGQSLFKSLRVEIKGFS